MMLRILVCIAAILFAASARAQLGLTVKGNKVIEILSSEEKNLRGILSAPAFSPQAIQTFSFVRQLEDNRYLYIYSTAARGLTEIKTVESRELEISLERSSSPSLVYNDQLDWRPALDAAGRQWFAFVSNGAKNNHDIYLGYLGGSEYLRLTDDGAIDNDPKWSPDGATIAFVSSRGGSAEIYLIKNLNRVIEKRDPALAIFEPLTRSKDEVANLAWNPNPGSFLLAYSKRVFYPAQQVKTFQIYLADLLGKTGREFALTDNPAMNYTRPQWDPLHDSRLLYLGQSLEEDAPANLYVAKIRRNENKRLEAADGPESQAELLKNIRLTETPAIWLSGSQAILTQQDQKDQKFPLYSVNLERRRQQLRRSVSYFEDINRSYPFISGFDEQSGLLLFSTQEGRFFKIFAAQLAGDDISLYAKSGFVMKNPELEGGDGLWKYILAGGVAGLIIWCPWCPDDDKENIGAPPDMPGVK